MIKYGIYKITNADPRFINSGINAACRGRFPTYKGYKWSYDT